MRLAVNSQRAKLPVYMPFDESRENFMSLAKQFAAYSQWRQQVAESIEHFRRWLNEQELGDAQSEMRLVQLLEKLKEDRLNVAFVAEFSRGKSELINSIFFAEYGNRILPSSAGRTTMCPTELMFMEDKSPSIELLPIETRSTSTSVSEFRRLPEEWESIPLDVTSAERMQTALQQVSEVIRVSPEDAARLGFSLEGTDKQIQGVDENGLVEIPRWRHAIINFPHPLLKQGLVILDTPGLNAIGAEPELTLSLLPNAHAVLFILAADTGVTQSDLAIWQEHIISNSGKRGHMVVLNKIDGLWDELKTPAEIAREISRQVHSCAITLGLEESQIFPVSAQKGLVAKITGDHELLRQSRLPELETALSEELIPAKQDIVRDNTGGEFNAMYLRIQGLLESRLSGLREQLTELTELQGKNAGVVEYMMGKIRTEKEEFEAGLQHYYAVRSVFSTLTNSLFSHLGLDTLRTLTHKTRSMMLEASFSKSLSVAMEGFFASSLGHLEASRVEIEEIRSMMDGVYKRLMVEYGLKLPVPPAFSLLRYEKELSRLQGWCNANLNTAFNLMTHEKRIITRKFFEEVALQVRKTFERANREAENWLTALMAPMETQVREHQIHLKRRLESIKRIHQATDTLEDRISELKEVEQELLEQNQSLEQITETLRRLLLPAGVQTL